MFCSLFVRHSLNLSDLFISLFARLTFVSIVITEVFRNEEFQYLLYQFLHATSALITIKKSFILTSSQAVTVMAVLDSSDSKVISTTLTTQADLLLLVFPSFTCVYQ